MTSSPTERSTYRPEIQGTRTIGALLVAVFHIWGGRVSGGVDVFFVISGFLITGSLYRELQRGGTIDVVAFWGRIVKRIAPMAFLVLAATLVAALIWMPHSRQRPFLIEVIYSALHLENLKLMMNAVDYLARDEAPSPVQQFWALSVQVQFYAVWPFLLLSIAFAARQLRRGASAFIAALLIVFLISLAYSVVQTRIDPSPTYFNPLARVWEFALGGILAVALPHLTVSSRLGGAMGWIGLAAVVSCGLLVPRFMHYPGYVALWPTLGAALVLLASGGTSRLGVNRVLASKPLVACGDISFAFYLWHWPVLVFALLISGRTQLGLQGGLAVIAIALVAAYASTRWIEQPILRSAIGTRKAWHLHAMRAALAAPVLMIAIAWSIHLGPVETDLSQGLPVADYPGGTVPASMETALKPGIPLRPTPTAAKMDIAKVYGDMCHQDLFRAEVIECTYGSTDEPVKSIALVGGSHSAHWLAALEPLAQQYRWRIVSITKSGCAFDANGGRDSGCIQWNKNVIEKLRKLKPDAVFTTSTRRLTRNGRKEEYIPKGYQEQWKRLAESGVSVIAVRDNPWLGFNVPECIEKNASNVMACSRPRRRLLNDVDPALALQPRPGNVAFIDMTDRFCDQSTCFPVSGNLIIYSDRHHITATFSRTLAGTLGERMKQVRPDLFPADAEGATDRRREATAG